MCFKSQLKSLTLVAAMATLLASCVAAVVAGAAAGMVYDKRGMMTMEADARLFHIIHTQLVKDPNFYDSRILVSSFNRVVLLVGQTPEASLRALAEKIARETAGVERVYNQITLGYPISLSQRSKDSLITSQVRSSMLAKKGLESGSIRVVTENGVAYLMGIVSDQQALIAVDVARRIPGVRQVVKVFQYIR